MRILGIDVGLVNLGLSCLNNGQLEWVDVIHHPKDPTLKYNEYLNQSIESLSDIFLPSLPDFPDLIVAEIIPVGRLGSNTELNIAASTVLKVLAHQEGIRWVDIAANSVKKITTGQGKAKKNMVKKAVIAQFPSILEMEKEYKVSQKVKRPKGFLPDVFDSVAVGWAGMKLYDKSETKENKETKTREI